MPDPTTRRTVVCRNRVRVPGNKDPVQCHGGGRWGDDLPARCPRCGGPLTDLYLTIVIDLKEPA